MIELLRRYAPTWLTQMPGLLSALEVEGLQRMTLGAKQTEDTTQLFFALRGLWEVYLLRAELPKIRTLAEQLLGVARRGQDPLSLLEAHRALGISLLWLGEVGPAQQHFAHSLALHDPQRYHSHAFRNALDSRVSCLASWSLALCHQGYPAQALHLARELGDPSSLAYALYFLARLHRFREEDQLTDERTEALTTLATEHGLPIWVAAGALLRGWVLVKQGQGEEGIRQIHQGAAAWRAMGTRLEESYFLALLAEAHGKVGQAADGLAVVAEALAVVDKNGERLYEAELYRLKGELSLQSRSSESGVRYQKARVSDPDLRPPTPTPDPDPRPPSGSGRMFSQAIAIARRQSAKSLELRAVMSLSRLWQQQGKQARQTLAEIYGWFTEGFDTADLQDAKALLQELS